MNWRSAFSCIALLSCAFLPVESQRADTSTAASTGDSIVDRARQLAQAGHGDQGRALLDSVLLTAAPDDSEYANALYGRAALATTATDSERFYERLFIEAPLSPRNEDALLQVAQLEEARGDRQSAIDHLTRFMLSYGQSRQRARAGVWLVRLLFDDTQIARGCAALRMARDAVPAENVETRNRLDYYAPRCANATDSVSVLAADTVAAQSPNAPMAKGSATSPRVTQTQSPAPKRATSARAAAPTRLTSTHSAAPTHVTPSHSAASTRPMPASRTPPAAPIRSPSAPAATSAKGTAPARANAAPAKAFFSVQIAAYDARPPAERMARSLVLRKIDARVDGTERPFRLRIGKYSTRTEADKAAASLKAQGITGFVTSVNVP